MPFSVSCGMSLHLRMTVDPEFGSGVAVDQSAATPLSVLKRPVVLAGYAAGKVSYLKKKGFATQRGPRGEGPLKT